MQTDILLKQITSSLASLRTAIDKFEKHASPSTEYAEQLRLTMNDAHKLVSAYVVLKEHKDISPELNLHLKIMSAQEPELLQELKKEEAKHEIKEELKTTEMPGEKSVAEPPFNLEKEKVYVAPAVSQPEVVIKPTEHKTLPKLSISINDKFRFINDLFAGNANEYNIAIEQLNTVDTPDEAGAYLKGLKSIYNWDEENEQVKRLFSLTEKRFL